MQQEYSPLFWQLYNMPYPTYSALTEISVIQLRRTLKDMILYLVRWFPQLPRSSSNEVDVEELAAKWQEFIAAGALSPDQSQTQNQTEDVDLPNWTHRDADAVRSDAALPPVTFDSGYGGMAEERMRLYSRNVLKMLVLVALQDIKKIERFLHVETIRGSGSRG